MSKEHRLLKLLILEVRTNTDETKRTRWWIVTTAQLVLLPLYVGITLALAYGAVLVAGHNPPPEWLCNMFVRVLEPILTT